MSGRGKPVDEMEMASRRVILFSSISIISDGLLPALFIRHKGCLLLCPIKTLILECDCKPDDMEKMPRSLLYLQDGYLYFDYKQLETIEKWPEFNSAGQLPIGTLMKTIKSSSKRGGNFGPTIMATTKVV